MADSLGVANHERRSFRNALLKWGESNLREFPWRETTNPYEVLVAEILLQKTLATKVPAVYQEFLRRYPDPSTLAGAKKDEVIELLEPLGFQNQRAKALVNLGGEYSDKPITADEDQLSEIRYVGPYATNAVLCFAFDQPRPIVDGNVVRIYNRAFGFDFTAQQKDAWEFAEWMLPAEYYQRYNLALLDFGASICVAGEPNCNDCFYSKNCVFFRQQS